MRIQDLDENGKLHYGICPFCKKKMEWTRLNRHKMVSHKS